MGLFFYFESVYCFLCGLCCILLDGFTLIPNFMKKFLHFSAVVLMMVGLTACFGSKDVVKFSISLKDQTGTTALTLTPDYSKRTLAVDYKKDYVDTKLVTKQKSVSSTGQMGGEYFDRFESMAKVVKNYPKSVVVEGPLPLATVKPMLNAVVESTDKKISTMEVSAEDVSEDVQSLKSFYNDIVKLLTTPEQV
jgi:hypothetical protein